MPTPMTNHYLRRIIADLKDRGVDFKPEDNPVNSYDRYAYHLQLFMINDRDSQEPNVRQNLEDNKYRRIIIAESGVTAGFNITECEIEDAVGHNFRNKNGKSVKVDFTIVEPYNMSLPDKLYEASVQLGVTNWRLAPMFLRVYIDYYDEEGRIPDNRRKSGKHYRLNIVDFNNTLTAAGTIYKLQCVVDNNIGFRNNFYIIPQTYTITSGGTISGATAPGPGPGQRVPQGLPLPVSSGTIGEFFQKFELEINKFYANLRQGPPPRNPQGRPTPSYEAQAAQLVFYEFNVEEELASQKIKFTPNVNNRRASFRQVGNNVEITVGRGISIGALVDDLCSSIDKPEFFIPNDQSGIIKVPWIECVVENIGWDYLLGDYVRRLRFFINVKQTRRPVPNVPFGRTFQLVEEFQNARLRSIADGGTLRKAYLYFYTGNNTEIINLDVKFNHLHYIPQPLTSASVLPPVFSSPSANPVDVQQALGRRASIQQRLDAISAEIARGASPARERELSDEVGRLIAEDNRLVQIVAERSVVIFDPVLGPLLESRAGVDLGQLSLETLARRNELIAQRQAAAVRRARLEFAEDVRSQQQNIPIANLTYITDPRDLINAVRPAQSGQDDVRRLYSSVTSQIYDRRSDMVNITMEIRGDPYWMGWSNLERNERLIEALPAGNIVGGQTFKMGPLPEEVYDPYDGYFLLAFRAGTIPNEQTGFMDLRDDVDFFNALYLVVQVTHIFRDGKFTQRLEATRDSLSNLGGVPPSQPIVPAVVRTGINQ